jgi:hypothetical protein
VAKPAVDQPAQAVFGNADLRGERSDRQTFAPPGFSLAHHLVEAGQFMLIAGVDLRFGQSGGRHRAEERGLGLEKDRRARGAEYGERRGAQEFVPIGLDAEGFANLKAGQHDDKQRHRRQEWAPEAAPGFNQIAAPAAHDHKERVQRKAHFDQIVENPDTGLQLSGPEPAEESQHCQSGEGRESNR